MILVSQRKNSLSIALYAKRPEGLPPAVALSNYINYTQYSSLYPRTTRIFYPQAALLGK